MGMHSADKPDVQRQLLIPWGITMFPVLRLMMLWRWQMHLPTRCVGSSLFGASLPVYLLQRSTVPSKKCSMTSVLGQIGM